MDIQTFLNEAWNNHAHDPQGVAARLPEGIQAAGAENVPALAALITHVMGEHLREWQRGAALLQMLAARGGDPAVIKRSVTALQVASGASPDLSPFGASEQARILAMAAAAISSTDLFTSALEKAEDLPTGDPALRALAVTGNNLACTLEETSSRTPEQDRLMLKAAQAARKYWEMAGGWMEVERAEYRLCMTYLQLAQPATALQHAYTCLDICKANSADAEEIRYAQEAVARALAAAPK